MASTLSLLGLPRDVRAQIFRKAGLVRKCLIGFAQEKNRLLRMKRGYFRGCRRCRGFDENSNGRIHVSGDSDSDDSPEESSSEDPEYFNVILSNFVYEPSLPCI